LGRPDLCRITAADPKAICGSNQGNQSARNKDRQGSGMDKKQISQKWAYAPPYPDAGKIQAGINGAFPGACKKWAG